MKKITERHLIVMILLTAAALGLTHTLVIPSWANVEEPTHFEHVRLIIERDGAQASRDIDLRIRQSIADSVVGIYHVWGVFGRMANSRIRTELGVFSDEDWSRLRDDLLADRAGSIDPNPLTLGSPQLSEPPGYYWLIASLQLLVPQDATVDTQLKVARLGSILLGLAAILMAYLTGIELFPDKPLLRISAPALLALLPSFTTIMSSVNNTVAAVFAVSFMLFAAVRLIRRGLNFPRLLLLLSSAVFCALSKPTAWIGIPLSFVAVPLARRTAWPLWVRWAALLVVFATGLSIVKWQWPRSWYPLSFSYLNDLSIKTDAPHGGRAFTLDASQSDGGLWQPLPTHFIEQLQGQTATVGAWMRASDGATSTLKPSIWVAPRDGAYEPLQAQNIPVSVTDTWQFYTTTVSVPSDTQCVFVLLAPGETDPPGRIVEYDGVVFAIGNHPASEPPILQTRSATRGNWDGHSFDNLITNGSAEGGQPLLRPELERALPFQEIADGTPLLINQRLAAYMDWRTNWSSFSLAIRWLFAGFWARFGWYIPGLPKAFIWTLGFLCIIAGIGIVRFALHSFQTHPAMPLWQRRALVFCLITALLIVAVAMLRLDPFTAGSCDRYYGRSSPSGYYVLPASMPLLLFWFLGLRQWLPDRWHRWLLAGCILGFFVMNVGSLIARQIPFFLAAYGIAPEATLWGIPPTWLP